MVIRVLRRTFTLAVCVAALLASGPVAGAQVNSVNLTTPWDYVVPPLTANCLENYHLFLPPSTLTKPPGGWPVLIHFDLTGFTATSQIASLPAGDWRIDLLNQRVAVITARGSVSALWPCTPPDPPGHGLFHPPGHEVHDSPTTTVKPYDDPDYPMAEKDAAMLIQHVRYNAGKPGNLVDLDPHRIAVHGVSAGAISLMWAAFGPERYGVPPFKDLGGQYDMPARPDAAVLRHGVVWWPIFKPNVGGPLGIVHFAVPDSDSTVAPTFNAADPFEVKNGSALYYDEVMLNPSLPTYLAYGVLSQCSDYDKNFGIECTPYPFCFENGGKELDPHPGWSGFAWTTLYGQDGYGLYGGNTKVAISNASVFNLQAPLAMQNVAAFEFPNEAAVIADMVTWIVSTLDDLPGPWLTIHHARVANSLDAQPAPVGVAGTHGIPTLAGSGTPASGSQITLALSGARENAPVSVVIGLDHRVPPYGHVNAPFRGGILVPNIDLLLLGFATNGAGLLSLQGLLPPGLPSFAKVYYQCWVADPAAAHGFAGSNALQSTTP